MHVGRRFRYVMYWLSYDTTFHPPIIHHPSSILETMTSSTNSAFRQALAAKDEEMRHAKEETQRYKLELAKVRKDHISEKEQLNTKLREMVNALELKGEAMAVERAALLHDQERWRNRSMKIAR